MSVRVKFRYDAFDIPQMSAAGTLQTAKLIRYSRGMITILDRRRLEANSCECYAIIKAESDEYLN